MNEEETYTGLKGAPYPVLVEVKKGQARESLKRFTGTFVVGRSRECDLQLHENRVSRKHLKIEFDGKHWTLHDLESSNGTFVNGFRVQHLPLLDRVEVELGLGGPVLLLTIEKPTPLKPEEPPATTKEFTTETQIIQHYMDKSRTEKVGEQTMMFRRAFERLQKKKSRKYLIIIAAALVLLAASGGFILHQKNKIAALTKTAEEIFYAMKSLEIQIGNLEDIILLQAKPKQLAELKEKRKKLGEMEKEYDKLVKELGIYAKMSEEDRTIVRTARTLGECELTVPKGFTREVKNYVRKWRSSDRLETSLSRAKTKGYSPIVAQVLARYELPPHYFFLALQESGFRDDAVGPRTRYGYAKGIWQLIPNTAKQYGLKLGPLFEESVYDRRDERFDFEKATKAAAGYLRDISNTEAQASGLLVMASYNWGENNTRRIIRQMPQNPRERNFWRLLSMKEIPQETHDYVFYIFSAAVICENPGLFGFDFTCPMATKSK
jgi:pSer/pThr/pTyr-binding forkhead associated (FHA) protein/soluble lytic murein transglycosylase-like protein